MHIKISYQIFAKKLDSIRSKVVSNIQNPNKNVFCHFILKFNFLSIFLSFCQKRKTHSMNKNTFERLYSLVATGLFRLYFIPINCLFIIKFRSISFNVPCASQLKLANKMRKKHFLFLSFSDKIIFYFRRGSFFSFSSNKYFYIHNTKYIFTLSLWKIMKNTSRLSYIIFISLYKTIGIQFWNKDKTLPQMNELYRNEIYWLFNILYYAFQ